MKTLRQAKGMYTIGVLVALSFMFTAPSILSSGSGHDPSVTDTTTGATFSVIMSTRVASISGSSNPNFVDFWFYVTNPSNNVSRTFSTFVDDFGILRTNAVPLYQIVITELDVNVNAPDGTSFSGILQLPAPTGAATSGTFPTPNSPLFLAYRWDFRGWGQTSVAPAEKTMIMFFGLTGYVEVGAYTGTATLHYTFEGASHTVTLPFGYRVTA